MLNTMIQPRTWLVAFLCLVVMAWTGVATAQLPVPDAASQFNIDGFLQEATLDTTCITAAAGNAAAQALCGGTMKINGQVIIVPANTIVILPANAMTWEELFACAPLPYGNGYIPFSAQVAPPPAPAPSVKCNALVATPQTGMALADLPAPLTSYDVSVTGNKAPTSTGAGDRLIAGLINISQQGLNSGQGYITNIVYGTAAAPDAELQIANPLDATMPFVRVKINDPATVAALSGGVPNGTFTGRYSVGLSPDPRFTVDQDNPTIAAGTGFPMCVPRVAPGGATVDDLCPIGNRPLDLTGAFAGSFTMLDPATIPAGSTVRDPRQQAPMEIGDYVTFAGTLVKDAPAGGFLAGDGPTAGPWPALGTAATYISAHTIESNIAIYTAPGTNPAYITTGVFILGTGGGQVLGAVEAARRTRFEGMMTDPSRMVHLYGNDLPCASTQFGGCDRDWGIIGVDQGPPTGAVKGRWRFRPPCAPFGTDPNSIKFDKQCIGNQSNSFLPATREMRSVIEPLPGSVAPPAWIRGQTGTFANGIIAGQYHAPILEYLFPEQLPGTPVPPANFESMPFLAVGGYTSSLGTTAPAALTPWPGGAPPCGLPPVASAFANPGSVIGGSGTVVTLDATATTGSALAFVWVQTGPIDPTTGLINPLVPLTIVSPGASTFVAPLGSVFGPLTFQVTATNCAGSSTATVSVTVLASGSIIVNHIPPFTTISGTAINSIPVSGTDPAGLPLTFLVTQSGAPALTGLTVTSTGPSSANITFSAPTLPLNQVTNDVVQLAVTATDGVQTSSPAEFATVTVTPAPDNVLVQAAQYRISKGRLTINASDTIVNPNLVLTLQPYVTTTGTTFDPCSLGQTACVFLNQGLGIYLLDALALPEPAVPPARPMVVNSSIGGSSGSFGLTSIRQ